MDESTKRITEGLQKAMRTESNGHHFYTMAANAVTDEKGREVFRQLAEDELMHLKFLRIQYRAFSETGAADAAAKLGPPTDFSGANPIFSDEIKGRIADAHFEMTALAIGIQLELSSEQYYREQAKGASDIGAQTFFLELAEWEAGHYRALLAQQNELKEDYWAAGGFAPF